MLELLTNFWFLVFAPAIVVPVTAIVASLWYKAHRDSLDASLKHEMLQRGMSADDIVKVLQARSGKVRFSPKAPSRPADEHVQTGAKGW